jgi:hypothetical protein
MSAIGWETVDRAYAAFHRALIEAHGAWCAYDQAERSSCGRRDRTVSYDDTPSGIGGRAINLDGVVWDALSVYETLYNIMIESGTPYVRSEGAVHWGELEAPAGARARAEQMYQRVGEMRNRPGPGSTRSW